MDFKKVFLVSLLAGGALASLPAHADTAEDCIADYEAMKAQFERSAIDGEFECVRIANSLNLFGTGSAPFGCSGEDEWHFEAKSVVGNPGSCKLRILGSEGEGCAAPLIERSLEPPEAAAWQNHVRSECNALGPTRGVGKQGGGES